jgi:hypothetical protein
VFPLSFLLALPGRAQTLDLCQGLVQDKQPRPMTALARPALGQAAREPQFGTLIRRVSGATPIAGEDTVIKPVYSTTSAWNADESLIILYRVGSGHQLYDGHDYSFIRALPIAPNEIEGFFWHTSDPDLLFYLSGKKLIRHHVSTDVKDTLKTFSCSGVVSADPHGFMSWDSNVFSLRCSGTGLSFFYKVDTNTITGSASSGEAAPLMGASGTLAYRNGDVINTNSAFQRSLDLSNPFDHAALGRASGGHDTFNGVQFDPGPRGSGVGTLVTHDMATGVARVIVGPGTGFPYPPTTTHISTLAYKQPGWVYASIVGDPAGKGLLQNELILADTNTGKVCRVGRHRSFGDDNTTLGDNYWAEPHVVASPSGTRALFGSDWGNGPSVDTYAVELPSYVWFDPATRSGDFDGDGKADLLWVNRTTRMVAVWLMNGAAVRSGANVRALADANWQVAGIGDFDHDGKSDLLLRQQASGALRVWLMNGASVRSETNIGSMADPQRLAATGDLDGDGNADLVWYNASSRVLTLWRLSGATVLAKTTIATLAAPARVLAAADFGGDGRADLLVRDGTSGVFQVWTMNGATATSKTTAATIADSNWQVLGTGDYDGDERADILLRNRSSGIVYGLLMNGATVLSEGGVASIADLNWRLSVSGDFDGNGRADVLFRNRVSGAASLLFLNGVVVTSAGAVQSVADQAWSVPATP